MEYLSTYLNIFRFFHQLLLISSLILLQSEDTLCIIFILLNLVRCVLWPALWSDLVNVPCDLRRICTLLLLDEASLTCEFDQMR